MGVNVIFWGEEITPGSQPVLMFPINSATIQLSVFLTSTFEGEFSGEVGGTMSGTNQEIGSPLDLPNLTDPADNGAQGVMTNDPQPGLSLSVHVSQDGSPFRAGEGTLSEIGAGYYSYVPATTETNNPSTQNSTNKGAVLFRFVPDTRLDGLQWNEETAVIVRIKPPGLETVKVAPNDTGIQQALTQGGPNSFLPQLENYINHAIRDLLGNQMTNKPTFTRDR